MVPPKETTSTPASVVSSASDGLERRGGVGEPGAVDVQVHAELVRGVGDRPRLVERVDGAELGRLGDRDDARLRLVLVAAPRLPAARRRRGRACRARCATVSSLTPASRSGAPHSSTCMCATSVQITASNGRVSASIEATLAPVPLKTKKARAPSPKCSRTAPRRARSTGRRRRTPAWPALAAAIASSTSGWAPAWLSEAKSTGAAGRVERSLTGSSGEPLAVHLLRRVGADEGDRRRRCPRPR